ncbi:RNA polymerase sigma factor RpoE [Pseudomonas duriflava]|uniref:RNA polymerase sigma factor n=2 Tax=Pseudomonas duriflava TaxID=459528 RepID=A0A562QPV2_9PSED|nr:RNA polymerase sigma factor RpoE [Pseudomonas duriflava]
MAVNVRIIFHTDSKRVADSMNSGMTATKSQREPINDDRLTEQRMENNVRSISAVGRTFTQRPGLSNQQDEKGEAGLLQNQRGAPMQTQEQDQQLVERVQRGDKRAFDLLVLKYQHKILGLIVRFVHDAQEAQDVAQEAFIKAYRALGNFRGDSAFYTWLYRIAINTAKNHLVARGRRPPDSDVSAEDAEFYEGDHALKDIESPERSLLRDEIESTVHRTIQQLPEDLRTALTLREFEGLSYEDIANVMQCPVGTVRSRIFRAREAIDKALQPLLREA